MIQKLIFHGPTNSLSIGQVSFNILRELYKRKIQVTWFPRQVDFNAYKVDPAFGQWLERAANNRYTKFDKNIPTLAVWHLNGSEMKPSNKQYLLSFHETDSPTESEVNIANQQEQTFFSSSWTVDNFKTYGAQNVSFVPLGLDEDFAPQQRRAPTGEIQWGLTGKAEQRKNTQLIISAWIKKYGGNNKHKLNLCVTNPFFKPELMSAFYASCFPGGQKPANVNVLPYLKTNAEMVQLYSNTDIDLSGFSSAEGWGLPAFTATAFGKWSIVTNCTAHKDWATSENSVLVEAGPMKPVYDGVFFKQGDVFNQGNVYDFNADQLIEAMECAEKLAFTPNPAGEKLRETFTYKRTVDQILEKIGD